MTTESMTIKTIHALAAAACFVLIVALFAAISGCGFLPVSVLYVGTPVSIIICFLCEGVWED